MAAADIFVTDGEELFVDILDGTTAVPTYHGAMGTGGTTAVKGDSAMETEVETRDPSTLSQPTASQMRFVSTIAAGAARAILEIGVLSLITGGILIFRATLGSAINLANGDSLEATVTLTVA